MNFSPSLSSFKSIASSQLDDIGPSAKTISDLKARIEAADGSALERILAPNVQEIVNNMGSLEGAAQSTMVDKIGLILYALTKGELREEALKLKGSDATTLLDVLQIVRLSVLERGTLN
jgi:hypothetical protein